MDTLKLPGVIGPAVDGGHYLIGLRAPGADLFENIAWSTETVLADTETRATDHNTELVHLLHLADIDILDGYIAWIDRLRSTCPETSAVT